MARLVVVTPPVFYVCRGHDGRGYERYGQSHKASKGVRLMIAGSIVS